jgi:hypothetical protein
VSRFLHHSHHIGGRRGRFGGEGAAQDIAVGMPTAVECLRAMTRAGLNINTAARQILFSISLGTHHFLAIAKLSPAPSRSCAAPPKLHFECASWPIAHPVRSG